MKYTLKSKWILMLLCMNLCTMLLTGCTHSKTETNIVYEHKADQLIFQVKNDEGTEYIKSWKDVNETHYVFLPSYCNLADVSIEAGDEIISMDGIELTDKESLEQFELNKNYILEINEQSYLIQFQKSSNVATLYIDTQSQSMENIHNDKEYKEASEVRLFTKEGELDYSTINSTLKGRGNTTWDFFEKKPYQLKLEEAGDLLGMGAAKKWILLANAFDETNLRNKLVYDLARNNNLCWAPECNFVDLYLNGTYNGLYLLTERVEFGENRLNIANNTDKFMCSIDYETRWATLSNAFLTDYGRAVEIREPDNPTEKEIQQIMQKVQEMENIILYSDDQTSLSNTIDIDSWVRKYLVDEIMENGDSDLASSYFYYANGLIYAGPLWDYDNTLGVSTRNQNPSAFLARSGYNAANNETPYYDALYNKEEFYERVVELYHSEFLPLIQEMIDTGIYQESVKITDASAMNLVRWNTMFEAQNAAITDAEGIADYLEQRIAFLNTAWIEEVDYCTIQFEPYAVAMYAANDTYATSYVVKRGQKFSDLKIPKITDAGSTVWIHSESGEIFDPEQTITDDITLLLKRE